MSIGKSLKFSHLGFDLKSPDERRYQSLVDELDIRATLGQAVTAQFLDDLVEAARLVGASLNEADIQALRSGAQLTDLTGVRDGGTSSRDLCAAC